MYNFIYNLYITYIFIYPIADADSATVPRRRVGGSRVNGRVVARGSSRVVAGVLPGVVAGQQQGSSRCGMVQ